MSFTFMPIIFMIELRRVRQRTLSVSGMTHLYAGCKLNVHSWDIQKKSRKDVHFMSCGQRDIVKNQIAPNPGESCFQSRGEKRSKIFFAKVNIKVNTGNIVKTLLHPEFKKALNLCPNWKIKKWTMRNDCNISVGPIRSFWLPLFVPPHMYCS